MLELQIVEQREVLGKEFRVYGSFEEPLFLAKDVAAWIEHSNPRMMLQSIDESEKVVNNVYTLGGNQESWFLTEDGLYEVLMQSRKPIAKEFKKQVKEILKTIRKNGIYAKDELLDNPDLLLEVVIRLKNEREARIVAEQQLILQQPLVNFAEACIASDDSILIRELSKLICNKHSIQIGEKKLYKQLREWGLILKNKTEPSQYAMDNGWFEVRQGIYNTPLGEQPYRTTLVTPKGQIYVTDKIIKLNSL